jgi:hypothetical protein
VQRGHLFFASVIVALAGSSGCAWREASVGFLFNTDACIVRTGALQPFGDVLSEQERQTIEQLARRELVTAFAPFRVAITGNPSAFWRIAVVRSLPNRASQALPRAGESIALGPLGGGGTVACDIIVRKAMQFAPDGATRVQLIEAVGRGVGRTAVHELVHQMLGAAGTHNDADPDSYEHGSSDRASQFYGTLHWTTALPLLRDKLGPRQP